MLCTQLIVISNDGTDHIVVVDWGKSNIVGVTIIATFLFWVPLTACISHYDRKHVRQLPLKNFFLITYFFFLRLCSVLFSKLTHFSLLYYPSYSWRQITLRNYDNFDISRGLLCLHRYARTRFLIALMTYTYCCKIVSPRIYIVIVFCFILFFLLLLLRISVFYNYALMGNWMFTIPAQL